MKALNRVFITYYDNTYAILEGKAAEVFQAAFMKSGNEEWVGVVGTSTTRFYNLRQMRTVDFDYVEEEVDTDLDT